jgi:hypothetical protein
MKYTLQLKTGDAELRALKNIPTEVYSNPDFALLVELTRGRKSKKDPLGKLSKRVDSLKTFLPDNAVVYFDVTSDPNLSNSEIDQLFNISNGYGNWQNFFAELQSNFSNSIPMLLVDDLDSDYSNFKLQIASFARTYKTIGYKIYPLLDRDTIRRELEIISEIVKPIDDVVLTIFYDQGYIVDGLVKIAESNAVTFFGLAHGILKDCCSMQFVLTSTSFPDSVTSLSKADQGVIRCAELRVYDSVVKEVVDIPIVYSDYGSITPKRNDEVPFYGNGWTPRIDVPVDGVSHIFYYRQKREKMEYADVYTEVARKCLADSEFPKDLVCWGSQTVKSTASGMKPGSTPSFWVSVRMNMFVTQQLRRLGIL